LGLDAYSSLELEYAEALRAGGVRGLIPGAEGFEADCVDGPFRGAGDVRGLGARGGSFLLLMSKVHGVRGAEGPTGLEVPRLSGVEVSKAFRSPRCRRFGADGVADLSGSGGPEALKPRCGRSLGVEGTEGSLG
jgi:hypothetical protein